MSKIEDYITKETQKNEELKKLIEIEDRRLEFAIQMANLRKNSGMTQKQLAELIGKPQSTISRIETGEMNPSIELIIEISTGLGKKFIPVFE